MFGKVPVKYTKKDVADVVTEADLKSNEIITKAVNKNFPDHAIVSEEGTTVMPEGAQKLWIIDPLDGTRNFSRHTPLFGISIAYVENNDVKAGAIYLPYFDEFFYSELGKGTSLNGKEVRCSDNEIFKNSFGCGGLGFNPADPKRKLLNSTSYTMWLSDFAASSVSAAFTCCGRRDFMAQFEAFVWDYAAASILLKESGCKVTNIGGDEWKLSDTTLFAANPVLHKQLLDVF